jgi:hypothetical protein
VLEVIRAQVDCHAGFVFQDQHQRGVPGDADLLRKEGVNVPLIIGGGAINGAFAKQRKTSMCCGS